MGSFGKDVLGWWAAALLLAGLLGVSVLLLRRSRRRRLQGEVPGAAATDASCLGTMALEGAESLFGPFRLVDRLAEGGMAEIFAAVRRDDRRGEPLVVKRLRAHLQEDGRAVGHFLAEGELASSLHHANIVRVLDHGQAEGRLYLTAEYVAGRDVGCLTRKMAAQKQRPLSATAILTIAREVAAALEYAHGKQGPEGTWLGLVHGDITPENILVSRAGEVKLLDFGIAQAQGQGHLGVGIGREDDGPHAGQVLGNVDFMSPEQALGQPLDPRSDLFSLGLVLYFCAARAPLYRARGKQVQMIERLAQAGAGPGAEEEAFVAGLAPPLPELLPRLLAIDPNRRLQSAAELGTLLDRALGSDGRERGRRELAATLEHVFGPALAAEQARLAAVADPRRARRQTAGERATVKEATAIRRSRSTPPPAL